MISFLFEKKNKDFFRLWIAQVISQFGDRIHQLALVGLIAERAHGSVTSLAKLMAFTILPVFLIQPLAGVLVDRWDRKKTLFVCDVLRGILVLTIPFYFFYKEAMLPIYIIVFCVFCLSRFYIPAKMSILPDLVEKDRLLMANSLVSTTGMIAFVLGCALGGFLIEWFGARNGFVVDAVTFFLSGAIIFSMTGKHNRIKEKKRILVAGKEIAQGIKRTLWQDLWGGIKYLLTHKEIRFIMDMMFALLAMAGSVYVVMIVFIQESFGSVTKHIGMLAVCLGLGLFFGAVGYGKWGKQVAWFKAIFICLISSGLMLIAFAVVVKAMPNVWVAGALAFLLGLVMGPIFIASNAVVQIVSDEQMRGKVFSALEIVIHLSFMLAMLFSSWLSKIVGTQVILIGAGAITFIVGVIGWFRGEHKKDVLQEVVSGQ